MCGLSACLHYFGQEPTTQGQGQCDIQVASLPTQQPFHMLAVEEMSEDHLVTGNGFLVQH